MNETALEHLRQARVAMVDQRRELDAGITAIDNLLTGFEGPIRTQRPARQVAAGGGGQMTVRDAMRTALADKENGLEMLALIAAVRELGVQAQDDTVRSIAVKMTRAGELSRPERGRYRLTFLKTSEDSAAGTAESSVTPNPKEGGESRETHRDNGQLSGWNDGHGRGSLVMEPIS